MALRRLSPLIPYLAVAVGVYGASSAWVAIGLYHIGMISVILMCRREKESGSARKGRSTWLYLTAIVFAAGGVALYFIWPYVFPHSRLIAERMSILGITRRNWPYFAVYFCLANSILEELFWRGCLLRDCRRLHSSDMFFGGYHCLVLAAFVHPLWTLPVFVACAFAGWLWRMLRVASGSLAAGMLTHLAADISIIIAVHLRLFA